MKKRGSMLASVFPILAGSLLVVPPCTAQSRGQKLPNPPITWEYAEDGGSHSGDIKHVDKVLINIDGEIYEWDSGMQIYSNSTYRWRFYKSGDTWYLERWSEGSSGWARDFTAKVSEA